MLRQSSHFNAAALAFACGSLSERVAVEHAVCVALAAALKHTLPSRKLVWLVSNAVVLADGLAGDVFERALVRRVDLATTLGKAPERS